MFFHSKSRSIDAQIGFECCFSGGDCSFLYLMAYRFEISIMGFPFFFFFFGMYVWRCASACFVAFMLTFLLLICSPFR